MNMLQFFMNMLFAGAVDEINVETAGYCWQLEPLEKNALKVRIEDVKIVGSDEIPYRYLETCEPETLRLTVRAIDDSKFYYDRDYVFWLPREQYEVYEALLLWCLHFIVGYYKNRLVA